MDDIDIEPPEAPVLGKAETPQDDVPLPPPKKENFINKLFKKKEKPRQKAPNFSDMATPSPTPPVIPPLRETTATLPKPTTQKPKPPIPAPELQPTFLDEPEAPPEPTHMEEELLPPPKVDEFYDAHMEELDRLKKKLGMEDEFIVPEDVQQEKPILAALESAEKEEFTPIEINIPDETENSTPLPEKPKPGFLKSFFKNKDEKKASEPPKDPELPTIADLLRPEMDKTPEETEQPKTLPSIDWTDDGILGMTGTVVNGKLVLDKITTPQESAKDPFADFKDREDALQETLELPPPAALTSGKEAESLDQGQYTKIQETIDAYVDSLEQALKEIVKTPYAKTKLKKPQGKNIDTKLFFKMHKATDLASMIKLLKTIESVNKVDLNTIAITSGKDIEAWLRRFIESERAKKNPAQVDEEITSLLDSALQEFKDRIAKERQDLEVNYAQLLKDKELHRMHKDNIRQEREALSKKKAEVDALKKDQEAIIAERVRQIAKEYDDKAAALRKEQDEFIRLKKRQDLEIFAEIEKVERLKQRVEAERFEQESQQKQLAEDMKKFKKEKDANLAQARKEIAEMAREKKNLEKEIISKRKALESQQKAYADKIKQQYFLLSDKLAKERADFAGIKEKEIARFNTMRETTQKEKAEILALRNELTKQEARIKAIVEEQKMQIRTDLDEIRKIDTNLEQVEINIRKQKEALEREGFQRYIKAKLMDINPESTGHPDFTQDIVEEHELEKALYKDIYALIEDCKNKLSKGKILEAKATYNEIRSKYAESAISADEKSILYNLIRELYDDIHLKSISNT